jgi:UDP-N-acetylmuramoyl-tripeptide--D-alanyl-D-alanine ligase
MPRLNFKELASMTGGTLIQGGGVETSSVVIDSREVKPDSVFFAIQGERLDGHDFLAQALETARGAVVSRVPENVDPSKGIVRVDDTTVALQRLARSIRERYDFTLIAITGSAGKTTTKEMIATLVATERRTFKSWGNFNNQIGNPLCVDNVPDDTQVVVSEMGMNHKGEIAQMAGNLRPDVGVYTNIGPVHIEFFGTVEKIAEAKRELLENVKAGGMIVINADSAQVMRISEGFAGRKVTYGIDHDADYRAIDIRERGLLGTSFTLVESVAPAILPAEVSRESAGRIAGATQLSREATHDFDLSLPGRHNLENLLAAVATARAVGISWEGIARGVHDLKPAYHRGVVVQVNGATIYDDTYNSNPYALASALELLRQAEASRRVAVIGDMLELGEKELDYHRDAGRAIPKEVEVVIGVGKRSTALLEGAREAGFGGASLHHFDDAQRAGEFLRAFIQRGDLVLLKASRGVGLDKAVAMLEEK